MMIKIDRIKHCFFRITEEKYPFRFIFANILWRTGLCRFLKVRRKGYELYFHPTGLSAALWKDPSLFEEDGTIICALLSGGDTYVDVGANIGHLSIEAALKVGKHGQVFAFEAHPRTASFLRKNIRLNRLGHVQVAQCAAGESFGWTSFTDKLTDDQNYISEGEGSFSLPVIPLDALLAEEKPTVIKIDVEGFEKFVLQGASNILEKTKFIYFEAWTEHFSRYEYSFSDIYEYLSGKGFSLGIVDIEQSVFHPIEQDFTPDSCLNILACRELDELKRRTSWIIK